MEHGQIGKPVYRKVISGDLSDNEVLAENVDYFIRAYGSGTVSGSIYRVIPFYEYYQGNSNILTARLYADTHRIQISIYSGGIAQTNKNCNIIIEYTKTTD